MICEKYGDKDCIVSNGNAPSCIDGEQDNFGNGFLFYKCNFYDKYGLFADKKTMKEHNKNSEVK